MTTILFACKPIEPSPTEVMVEVNLAHVHAKDGLSDRDAAVWAVLHHLPWLRHTLSKNRDPIQFAPGVYNLRSPYVGIGAQALRVIPSTTTRADAVLRVPQATQPEQTLTMIEDDTPTTLDPCLMAPTPQRLAPFKTVPTPFDLHDTHLSIAQPEDVFIPTKPNRTLLQSALLGMMDGLMVMDARIPHPLVSTALTMVALTRLNKVSKEAPLVLLNKTSALTLLGGYTITIGALERCAPTPYFGWEALRTHADDQAYALGKNLAGHASTMTSKTATHILNHLTVDRHGRQPYPRARITSAHQHLAIAQQIDTLLLL